MLFYPAIGKNQVVTPGAASAQITIDSSGAYNSVMVTNAGSKLCHVRVGVGPLTASTADIVVLSGDSLVLGKAYSDDALAYISADGTTLHVHPGQAAF